MTSPVVTPGDVVVYRAANGGLRTGRYVGVVDSRRSRYHGWVVVEHGTHYGMPRRVRVDPKDIREEARTACK